MSKKELNDLEPKEGATLDDWKEWSKRLKSRISKLEENDKNMKSNVKALKYDIECKEQAVINFKHEIAGLKNTIENLKSNKHYRFSKFVSRIFNKVIHWKK